MNKLDFLQITSIQRGKLKDEHQKPGWNLWALIGAFASLIWISISIFENNKSHQISSIYLAIVLYFSRIFINVIWGFISSDSKSKFINFKEEIAGSLLIHLYSIFTTLFIYIFLIWNNQFESLFENAIIHFFFLFLLLVQSILLILARVNIPVNINPKALVNQRTNYLIYGVLFIVFTIIVKILCSHLLLISDYTSIKLGLIFFSLHFVIEKLFSSSQPNTLLRQIDDLIDDITFDKISISDGEKRLKLIIYGLQFNHIVSPLVDENINLTKQFNEYCEILKKRIERLNSEKNETDYQILFDAIRNKFEELNKVSQKIILSNERIRLRLGFYRSSEKNNPDYINISDLLQRLENERNDKLNELTKYKVENPHFGHR